MMNMRVHTSDIGYTIVNVYDNGILINKVTGYTRGDAISDAYRHYPLLLLVVKREMPEAYNPVDFPAKSREKYTPMIDVAVNEIMREVQQDRLNGRLRPFVEGEPIGTIPLNRRVS